MQNREPVTDALARAVTDERLRIVATLIRVTGDWDLAEDCLQDAMERALGRWPVDGVPDNPAAWLTTTAQHRALDVLRRRHTEVGKLQELMMQSGREPAPGGADDEVDPAGRLYRDDRLRLLFTCAHPALPLAGRVALTLTAVAGLSTRETARAFLVSESTMGRRLSRTKQKISNAGISFRVPAPHRLAARTAGVLAVVYLIFNEGYAATEGSGVRPDLATEAVRLADLLTMLLPDDDEAHGLRALLLLQHSRRAARTDAAGDLVPMEEQDRSQWDHSMIAAGVAVLEQARASGHPPGRYRLQAEIAAVHACAATGQASDWARAVAWYDALLVAAPSPVAALNRAVAVGFASGPAAGLQAMQQVSDSGALAGYHLLPAVRADLLRRSGRPREALAAYRQALDLVRTAAERRFLERRIGELTAG